MPLFQKYFEMENHHVGLERADQAQGGHIRNWPWWRKRRAGFTGSGIPIKLLYTPLDTLHLKYMRTWDCPVPHPFTVGSTSACTVNSYGLNGRYAGMERLKKQTRDLGFLMRKAKPVWTWSLTLLPFTAGFGWPSERRRGGKGRGSNRCPLKICLIYYRVSISKRSARPLSIILSILFCMYVAAARKQGIPLEKLAGTLQNRSFHHNCWGEELDCTT